MLNRIHRAQRAGYLPEIILAGRRINDAVGVRVSRECVRLLLRRGVRDAVVTVLGLTFKEDIPDIRNSRVFDIVATLKEFGIVNLADLHQRILVYEHALREGAQVHELMNPLTTLR